MDLSCTVKTRKESVVQDTDQQIRLICLSVCPPTRHNFRTAMQISWHLMLELFTWRSMASSVFMQISIKQAQVHMGLCEKSASETVVYSCMDCILTALFHLGWQIGIRRPLGRTARKWVGNIKWNCTKNWLQPAGSDCYPQTVSSQHSWIFEAQQMWGFAYVYTHIQACLYTCIRTHDFSTQYIPTHTLWSPDWEQEKRGSSGYGLHDRASIPGIVYFFASPQRPDRQFYLPMKEIAFGVQYLRSLDRWDKPNFAYFGADVLSLQDIPHSYFWITTNTTVNEGSTLPTFGWVCGPQLLLDFARAVSQGSESRGIHYHILLFQIWDLPNLVGRSP
jgi:hypothetical protein